MEFILCLLQYWKITNLSMSKLHFCLLHQTRLRCHSSSGPGNVKPLGHPNPSTRTASVPRTPNLDTRTPIPDHTDNFLGTRTVFRPHGQLSTQLKVTVRVVGKLSVFPETCPCGRIWGSEWLNVSRAWNF